MRITKSCRAGVQRIAFARDDLGQAEVKHFGSPTLGYKNIRRLDIAVNNAFAMCIVQRVGN